MKNEHKFILAISILVGMLAFAWVTLWQRQAEIRKLESSIADARADVAELRGDIEDMAQTPLAYLMLYRRATLARFEKIEPRWDKIMEASWRLANKHGVSPEITIAKIEHESFFTPEAIGPCGELGLMQIYPPAWPQFDTSRGMDIEYNIDFGCRVFASCMKIANGNIREALRLYNGRGNLPEGMIPYADRVLNGRTMKIK